MSIDTAQIAYDLMNATDEEFAEVFAYFNKYRKEMKVTKSFMSLQKNDMKFNIPEFTGWITKTLGEIIYNNEIDSSAWWKVKTPKENFLAQSESVRERLLMEVSMRGQEIFLELEDKKLIEPDYEKLTYMDIWNDIKELSYKFEYEHYDDDDFLIASEAFFALEFEKLYPVKTIRILVYTSEVISNYSDKNDMIKNKIMIETNRDDLGEFLNCTKNDIASTKGQFQCWLDNYTPDDSKGLFAWLVKNGKEFKIIY